MPLAEGCARGDVARRRPGTGLLDEQRTVLSVDESAPVVTHDPQDSPLREYGRDGDPARGHELRSTRFPTGRPHAS